MVAMLAGEHEHNPVDAAALTPAEATFLQSGARLSLGDHVEQGERAPKHVGYETQNQLVPPIAGGMLIGAPDTMPVGTSCRKRQPLAHPAEQCCEQDGVE